MKKRYRTAIIVILILVLIACLVLVITKCIKDNQEQDMGEITDLAENTYVSPIDFAELRDKNPDIYAWLDIPNTDISYPVLQSAKDDNYYLYRNEKKKRDYDGALFTEHMFNSNDMSDKVTVVYGHHMRNGRMFGNLEEYYVDRFDELRDIIVYTPTAEKHYKVFAAIPYSNRHILYYFDCFREPASMQEFLDDIYSTRAIGANIDKDMPIDDDDKLLVLSTCLTGNRTNRFLVIGVEQEMDVEINLQ